MKFKFLKWLSPVLAVMVFFANPAFADEGWESVTQEMKKTISNLQKIVQEQNQKISNLENRESREAQIQPVSTGGEVPPPMSEYEFNDRLNTSLGGANKWLKDLAFKGDIRLRYEAFTNHSGSASENDPRNRFRFRLRYGFEKKFNDEMLAGFSMASGEANASNGFNQDPTSPNQSLTNDFNYKNIWIEKVYATYTPNWAKVGPVKKLQVTGGKFDNPFEKGSSDMVWDRDVKPEGIYEKVDFGILPGSDLNVSGWLTAGQMPVKESATHTSGASDASLFAEQAGLNAVIYTPLMERPVDYTGAASFYGWRRYAKDNNFIIGAGSLARGNSNIIGSASDLDVSDFNVAELYSDVAFYPGGLPVRPYVDWSRNFGGDNPTGMIGSNDLDAWAVGIKFGSIVKKGDWEALYQYKYIEANALPGFNDSDFGFSGFNGNAGNVLKLGYAITDYLTVNLSGYFVRTLNEGTSTIFDERQTRIQSDLVWKF